MRRLLCALVIAFGCGRADVPLPDDGVFRAVILGDSVARGAGDESRRGIAGRLDDALVTLGMRTAPTVNLGIDGARTGVVQQLLNQPTAQSALRAADAVIVSIGGNDLYGDSIARLLAGVFPAHSRRRTLARVARVVAEVHRISPAAQIYVIGLYDPYRNAWIDRQVDLWDAQLIERFAASRRVTVIRVCDLLDRADRISPIDRFHPSASGYTAIAQRIAAAL
jgi:lysophospholipase L1-like esterase